MRTRDVFIDTAQLPLVNDVALDQAVRAVCPNFHGVSVGKNGVVLHFAAGATDEEREAARQIALMHNPADLTTDQVETRARKEQRETLIHELKKRKDDPLAEAVALLLEALG